MNLFDGIEEFVAVARTGGFAAAARQLGVSTSHVSRKVAALEARLGSALMIRTTRRVRLTETGQTYFELCGSLLNGIEQANESVSSSQAALEGVLRVSGAGDFAERYVAAALAEFAKHHPRLRIEMQFDSRFVDFAVDRIDFAIRYGRLPDADVTARKLVDRMLAAGASPGYLAANGTPESPEALVRHDCIVTNSARWRFSAPDRSAERQQNQADFEVRVESRWQSNSTPAVLAACRAGLGIAYMPLSSFGSGFEDGSLVPILRPYWHSAASTWIVFPQRAFLPARARRAIDFLVARFAGWVDRIPPRAGR